MRHLLVLKQPLSIGNEMSIPLAMSHTMESKADALRWGLERAALGLPMRECMVMPVSLFKALGGVIQEAAVYSTTT